MNSYFHGYYENQKYREMLDLTLSIAILGLALSLRYLTTGMYQYAFASFLAIGIGFVVHELAHRHIARRLGAFSRYKAWYLGLLVALLIAIATRGRMIFAAPGAVEVYLPWYMPRAEAAISFAGPLANIIVALVCLLLKYILPIAHIYEFIDIIAYVNCVLAFFNLLPIPPLDGYKVLRGFPILWVIFFALSITLFVYYIT